ncbi:hypothetical protein F4703DRAFT_1924979 [Phycomyces blakesleeanus]
MPLLERLVLDMNLADFENEEDVLSRILNVKPAMKLKRLRSLGSVCIAKALKIQEFKVLPSTDEYERPKNHGLEKLYLLYTITTCNLLEYLSVRCRHLYYMYLDLSKIYGKYSNGSSRIDIDMSYTHFKYIPSRFNFIAPTKHRREKCAGDADYIILSQTSSSCPIINSGGSHSDWSLYSDTIKKDKWYFARYRGYYSADGYIIYPLVMTEEDITTVARIL